MPSGSLPLSLHRLVYLSTSTRPLHDQDLADISSASARNNSSLAITGFLLYLPPYFIQLLEGPLVTIRALYDKISLDSRHKDCLILSLEPISRRRYGDWAMATRSIAELVKMPAMRDVVAGLATYIAAGIALFPGVLTAILRAGHVERIPPQAINAICVFFSVTPSETCVAHQQRQQSFRRPSAPVSPASSSLRMNGSTDDSSPSRPSSAQSVSSAADAARRSVFLDAIHLVATVVTGRASGGFVLKFTTRGGLLLFAPAAVVDMLHCLTALVRRADDGGSFHLTFGATMGPLLLGTLGTGEQADATVVGDTVNVAARLASITSPSVPVVFDVSVLRAALASPEVDAVPPIVAVGPLRVKGRVRSVDVFGIAATAMGSAQDAHPGGMGGGSVPKAPSGSPTLLRRFVNTSTATSSMSLTTEGPMPGPPGALVPLDAKARGYPTPPHRLMSNLSEVHNMIAGRPSHEFQRSVLLDHPSRGIPPRADSEHSPQHGVHFDAATSSGDIPLRHAQPLPRLRLPPLPQRLRVKPAFVSPGELDRTRQGVPFGGSFGGKAGGTQRPQADAAAGGRARPTSAVYAERGHRKVPLEKLPSVVFSSAWSSAICEQSRMIRVLYVSRATVDLTPTVIANIAETSKRNNARIGVTGMLVCAADVLLQYLEGPASAVMPLLSRIFRDRRHSGSTILTMEVDITRRFADWAMDVVAVEDLLAEAWPPLADFIRYGAAFADALRRYLPTPVALRCSLIAACGDAAEQVTSAAMPPEVHRVALIMFDTVMFTRLLESAGFPETQRIVETVADTCGTAIVDSGGVIYKFAGDAVGGYFPGTAAGALAALQAAKAGVDGVAAVRNAEPTSSLIHYLYVGAGLHAGSVEIGVVGGGGAAGRGSTFAVVGEAAETVEAVEAATRSRNVAICATSTFCSLLGGAADAASFAATDSADPLSIRPYVKGPPLVDLRPAGGAHVPPTAHESCRDATITAVINGGRSKSSPDDQARFSASDGWQDLGGSAADDVAGYNPEPRATGGAAAPASKDTSNNRSPSMRAPKRDSSPVPVVVSSASNHMTGISPDVGLPALAAKTTDSLCSDTEVRQTPLQALSAMISTFPPAPPLFVPVSPQAHNTKNPHLWLALCLEGVCAASSQPLSSGL
eukprot:TRINITY_DN3764_c0_g1_i1.p1 TRINITY_DN3764_c0_g1~~TRINITY_DN3764_c0_g1_i1.p1  ORF type:complete len:1144 (+),score=210.15 TRINITY_DN3764_c0_g1_i1:141-3572(+)